jgi:uncharacterized integral membrane protein
MVSKQYTKLALLLPIAMITGTVISIYAYKQSQQGISVVMIIGSLLLIILLFYLYGNTRKKEIK